MTGLAAVARRLGRLPRHSESKALGESRASALREKQKGRFHAKAELASGRRSARSDATNIRDRPYDLAARESGAVVLKVDGAADPTLALELNISATLRRRDDRGSEWRPRDSQW